uniref:Transmembrane protein n=1 Tax=Mycena chlorophos TaxID=658473 RepID=A0ABQ0LU32_MYCCL|nr:predicted protein [Mycena chlorophos]
MSAIPNAPTMLAQHYVPLTAVDEKARLAAHEHDLLDEGATHAQWSHSSSHDSHSHCKCHNARLRRFLLPALVVLLSLLGVGALMYASVFSNGWGAEGVQDAMEGLWAAKRAVVDGDGDSTSGNGSTFTKHKLYLIVVFVGLFVVLILGIMLSAWCCRESFENPLCCPCYLCACCGGLACLECIACGLCVEGAEQV